MKKIYLFFIASLFAVVAYSQSTTLVISQAYGGGGNSGSVYTNDFIEIFNKSSAPISLNGYSVQYASTTGSAWAVTPLTNVTLQPGQYYLIQEAAGAGGTTSLPTPNATGTIAMGGTGFKVALVNTTAALSGTCPSGSSIIDFVGCSGTANCSEGATAPAPSNANSISRKLNGCQDTQNNSSDFTAGAAAPRNTSTAVNLCSVSCTTPSQKPTNIRYGGSPTTTSMTVYFTRGNGTGSLVLCRQAGPVNTTPVTGTTYTTNTFFGTSTPINTDNYPVFSTTYKDVNAFTLTGLTAGTKYYFSVFEYNDPGKCYTTTGLVDSFIVGGKILIPGDMAFVGWDNAANAGEDKLYIMNMVDITKGTKFSLVNSRFEAGAAANVRTNKWYGGSTDPYEDPEMLNFEYVGTTIAKGSVISMESNSGSGFTDFTINGASVPASDFTATTGFSNFLSTTGSDADQLYITQGKFASYGTVGVDRYNLLNGLVIHGITTRTPWVPLTSAVSTGGGASRESRIPPDILCFSVEFGTNTNGVGVYKHSAGITGTKNQLLTNIRNTTNWVIAAGTNNVNDVLVYEPAVNTPFSVTNNSDRDGQWEGSFSSDWFDCNNWVGLHVPDSTTTVRVGQGLPFFAQINVATSSNAKQYSNTARASTISVAFNGNGSLSLLGSGNEKLIVENGLGVGPSGNLSFENNANALTDTIWVHNHFIVSDFTGFTGGMGTVVLDEARINTAPYQVIRTAATELSFYKLAINNTRSVNIISPVRVTNNLNLQSGYLNTSAAGTLTLSSTATITSPANVYGQSNRGYFNSFVNGKMLYDADASSTTMIFPIGKYSTTDTAYAPVELTKANTTVCTYDAEYFPASYSDGSADIGQLDHVSSLEHWAINSTVPNADAKVLLSWRPRSEVGNGVPANDATALNDLVVSHYLDADGAGTEALLWHIEGSDVAVMPKNGSATVNYGTVTTNLFNSISDPTSLYSSSYFTLGTRSPFNILPLKLLDFTAIMQQGAVSLKWKTSEEQDVNYYDVEKSSDGRNFTKLVAVASLNYTAIHIYNTIDNAPVMGWNYYRLKVVAKGGKISYTLIVKVWNGEQGNFLVYPNPAHNELKINLPASSSISEIEIVNSEGRVVKQLATTAQTFTINIESLSKGVYFIRILNSRQAIAQKFTKQ